MELVRLYHYRYFLGSNEWGIISITCLSNIEAITFAFRSATDTSRHRRLGYLLPCMASVIGVLSIVFYVFAVFHSVANMQEWFSSIGYSAYTLFQVMTLASWSMGIVRPIMALFPLSLLFFVPFIIITSFAVFNLFIGIIVDAMQVMHEEEGKPKQTTATKEDMLFLNSLGVFPLRYESVG